MRRLTCSTARGIDRPLPAGGATGHRAMVMMMMMMMVARAQNDLQPQNQVIDLRKQITSQVEQIYNTSTCSLFVSY